MEKLQSRVNEIEFWACSLVTILRTLMPRYYSSSTARTGDDEVTLPYCSTTGRHPSPSSGSWSLRVIFPYSLVMLHASCPLYAPHGECAQVTISKYCCHISTFLLRNFRQV
jgi:hypothetical protein